MICRFFNSCADVAYQKGKRNFSYRGLYAEFSITAQTWLTKKAKETLVIEYDMQSF